MPEVAPRLSALLFAATLIGAVPAPVPPTYRMVLTLSLSEPFDAPADWRLVVRQGPDIPDPLGEPEDKAPGVLRLCISPDGGRTCRPGLENLLASGDSDDLFSTPHFLNDARIVHPRGDLPLLLIQISSLHSTNGDQRVATTGLIYDRARNGFIPIYTKRTGRNNNQEIRYIGTGPLQGAMISAEPTSDAPFAFWMTVNRIGPGNRYRQVLRYRSATRYGDGNPLAVIDSEMPNLQQRLGLWRPGMKVPVPAGSCPAPRLIQQALWCSAKRAGPE